MSLSENKLIGRRLRNAYVSAIVSISMVLWLVGVAALLLVNAGRVSDFFKENLQVSVLMKTDVSEERVLEYQAELDRQPFIKGTRFVSRQQGEEEMKEILGEDFLSVFEVSPIPASIDVTLKAEYVEQDSLKFVEDVILQSPLVDEVAYQASLVEALSSNIRTIGLFLCAFIALLLFVSTVLIYNTVRISVFSNRFTLHTMKLVGATRAFIRAPFLVKSVFQGLLSAMIAIILLLALLFVIRAQFEQLFEIFGLTQLMTVLGIVVAAGVLICVTSTFFVVNKFISLTKDEIYI